VTTSEASPGARTTTFELVEDDASAALVADGLTKRYGRIHAVDALSFRVPRGGVVGFVGPNGAGKTTTIRMLMGLIRPTSGDALVLGEHVTRPDRYLHRVGALIESPSFYAALSGRRNLRALAILGDHDPARVDAVLEAVGLAARADDAYGAYSLGMKQRLGIAAALLPDPELLILDEPTNGLDPSGIREVRALLRRLGDEGRTVFVSSHLLAEVQKMCDRLIVLRKGRLVFAGTVDALLARQVGVRMVPAEAGAAARLAEVLRSAGHEATLDEAGVLVRAAASKAPDLTELAVRSGVRIREVRPQGGDLEDTVLGLTGEGEL
jgi:ABC-2 type transport system ATP-binding protein